MKILRIVIFFVLCSCDKRVEDSQSLENESSVVEFSEMIPFFAEAKEWTITFSSREGAFNGMDSDSEISFRKNGTLQLIEYGYAPQYYYGDYATDSGGVISVKLEGYPREWPKMVLKKTKSGFFLFRSDEQTKFEFGGRAAAYEDSEMKPFWPFGVSKFSWERKLKDHNNGVEPPSPKFEGMLPTREPKFKTKVLTQ